MLAGGRREFCRDGNQPGGVALKLDVTVDLSPVGGAKQCSGEGTCSEGDACEVSCGAQFVVGFNQSSSSCRGTRSGPQEEKWRSLVIIH